MAKKDDSKKERTKAAPQGGDIHVGGNVTGDHIVVGSNNVITNYYQNVEKNTQPNAPDFWFLKHRYGLSSHFTGRVAEREFLTQWLAGKGEQPLLVLRALGGFGKSALTWYWLLHDVDRSKWSRVVWWGFYDDNNFETFLKETLEYLNVDVPQSARQQAEALLRTLERQNVLLVMDGFERALRAFSGLGAAYQLDAGGAAGSADEGRDLDCVSTVAEEFLRGFASSGGLMQGRVLMTTRLTPRALFVGATHASPLHGMIEHELSQMHPADAVAFFQKQEIRGTVQDIERACAAYGFHPLSLRLLAGLIVKDKRQPLDIRAAERYAQKVSADAVQRQHHVLEQSYAGLAPEGKALLGRLACFRSSVTYDTLAAVEKEEYAKQNFLARMFGGKPKIDLEKTLDDLATRGLIHQSITQTPITNHETPKRSGPITNYQSPITIYDLHPIVRRYAYDRLTAPERTGVHTVLIVYFDAVPKPQKVEKLEDLDPVIELYHHTVRAGKLDEAFVLFRDRLQKAVYYQFGAYQLIVELLQSLFFEGDNKPPKLKTKRNQSFASTVLANAYSLSGQPIRAVPFFQVCANLDESENDKKNLAIDLGNVATQQLVIGALSEAERNLRRQIDLCREIEDEGREAVGHRELGRVLFYRGEWNDSEQELETAEKLFVKEKNVQSLSVTWSYRALRFLLMARQPVISSQLSVTSNQSSVNSGQLPVTNYQPSIQSAQRALELAEERHKNIGRPNVRDYIRAYWLLGSAYRANNELDKAEDNLTKALNQCRQINMVDHEAYILLDLSKLRHAQGGSAEALRLAQEASFITERSGYVLTGADVHLMLATLAVEGAALSPSKGHRSKVEGQGSDKEAAIYHAKEALRLATCEGGEYKYKVAYEEAERMLEKLK